MPEQTCRTCDYFTMDPTTSNDGWCAWATRQPVPPWLPNSEHDVWAGAGETCPCWRAKGHIEAFMAEARARRNT